MTGEAIVRLDQTREQQRLLEDAILEARKKYGEAERTFLAAYLESILEELYSVRARIDTALGLDELRSDAASLWIRLRGGRIGEGRAPAQVVGRILEALQKGARQVAAFLELGTALVHRIPKEIGTEASLDVITFAPGSTRIAIAPSTPQYRVDKPFPLADMALQQIVAVALWAESGEADAELDHMIPNAAARRQTLSRIREVAPSSTGEYRELYLSGPVVTRVAARDTLLITPSAYSHASDFLERRREEPTSLGGRLVAIDVEKTRFYLRYKGARIRCDFPASLLQSAKRLIGEYVEVGGTGFFARARELPARIRVKEVRALTGEEIGRLR